MWFFKWNTYQNLETDFIQIFCGPQFFHLPLTCPTPPRTELSLFLPCLLVVPGLVTSLSTPSWTFWTRTTTWTWKGSTWTHQRGMNQTAMMSLIQRRANQLSSAEIFCRFVQFWIWQCVYWRCKNKEQESSADLFNFEFSNELFVDKKKSKNPVKL